MSRTGGSCPLVFPAIQCAGVSFDSGTHWKLTEHSLQVVLLCWVMLKGDDHSSVCLSKESFWKFSHIISCFDIGIFNFPESRYKWRGLCMKQEAWGVCWWKSSEQSLPWALGGGGNVPFQMSGSPPELLSAEHIPATFTSNTSKG